MLVKCGECGKGVSDAAGACPNCGAPASHFVEPPAEQPGLQPVSVLVQAAPKRKSPSTAAILNFIILGAGYAYAGRRWGWILVVLDVIVTLALLSDPVVTGDPVVMLSFALLHIGLAWHAYHMVIEANPPPD